MSHNLSKRPSRARLFLLLLSASTTLALSGCVSTPAIQNVRNHKLEQPIIYTSPVRNSATPLNAALGCYGKKLREKGVRPLGIAVGDIKDYTGKQGQDEGYVLTQGGALMAYSALGKMDGAVRIHERFDSRIADAELVYMNQRQLGDGSQHTFNDPQSGKESTVPWKPYFGGSVRQSDYYIVGGITELNYNIRSGGGEVAVGNVGPKARVYTMNVAVDLRIVGTQSLLVYDTVSVEKQVSGYEVGLGVFRFFGSNLFDVNVGAKNQEPLQLGVRTAIEAAVVQLIASVTKVSPGNCVPAELGPAQWNMGNADAARTAAAEGQSVAGEKPTQALAYTAQTKVPGVFADLQPVPTSERFKVASGGELSIIFGKGATDLDAVSKATLDRAASLVKDGKTVNLTIANRDGADRQDEGVLREARMATVVMALTEWGISLDRTRVLWQAEARPTLRAAIDGGHEEIARLRIG